MTRDDLRNIAQKRRTSMDIKLKQSDQIKESLKKADYQFIDSKAAVDSSVLIERNNMMSLQEVQVKRLDKVDKLLGDGETKGPGSFLGMATLGYYFDQFAQEMLTKPSKATTLIDLHEEISNSFSVLASSKNEDVEMTQSNGNGLDNKNNLVNSVTDDLSKAFSSIFA